MEGRANKQSKPLSSKQAVEAVGARRSSREGRERSLYCPRTTQEDATIHDPLLLHTLQESREGRDQQVSGGEEILPFTDCGAKVFARPLKVEAKAGKAGRSS